MNEWRWSNQGVRLEDDHLLWYEDLGAVAYASGGACTQTFGEFLLRGPRVEGVPPEIAAEVDRAVHARLDAAGISPEAAKDSARDPDFDLLSRTANAPGADIADQSALYAAAFQLTVWLFIARGELPDIQPYVAVNPSVADGAPMLKAFTDSRRLHAFAKECGLTDPDGKSQMLALPVKGILPTMAGYAERGVTHIHFNADQGSDGFYAPLAQLPPIHRYLVDNGLL